jgi:hypothetical protein
MRIHFQQLTEPIFHSLARFQCELVEHPLLEAARAGRLSPRILREFAYHQYIDSVTWIPMLAQMKVKATRSRRLQQAIAENIAHEAGLDGESHVTLAIEMLRSMGIRSLEPFDQRHFGKTASMWLGDEFQAMAEPAIAGWLLVAETLVPIMFAHIEPCFRSFADTRYFNVHVSVDSDEHSAWMAESVDDIVDLYGPSCLPIIEAGMIDAWEETREVPDHLWELQQCA